MPCAIVYNWAAWYTTGLLIRLSLIKSTSQGVVFSVLVCNCLSCSLLCLAVLQVHDNAGGIGRVLGSLAGKAVSAVQGTSETVKEQVGIYCHSPHSCWCELPADYLMRAVACSLLFGLEFHTLLSRNVQNLRHALSLSSGIQLHFAGHLNPWHAARI